MKREMYTCSMCFYCFFDADKMEYRCRRIDEVIRWPLTDHGCGDFGCTNSGGVEIPLIIDAWGPRP